MDTELGIRVNSANYADPGPDWQWDTHPGLPDYDLVVLRSGCAEYVIDGQIIEARPGTALLFRPGMCVRGTTEPSAPIAVVFMHFDFVSAPPSPDALPRMHRHLPSPEMLLELMERVIDAGPGPQRDAWGLTCLYELWRVDARTKWTGPAAEQAAMIETMRHRIRHQPGQRWRVSELAEEAGCTPDHLRRLFRKYLGETPGEVILQARTNAARALLADSSLSVTRIAEVLGYGDVYAFCRQFRQRVGQSPGAWRRSLTGQ